MKKIEAKKIAAKVVTKKPTQIPASKKASTFQKEKLKASPTKPGSMNRGISTNKR